MRSAVGGTDRCRDACSHQALGHGILPVLDEEVYQSQERIIVNLLRFSCSFVNAPKRQESINQVKSATGLAADAQVGFIVEALFLQVQPELAIRLALWANDLLLFIGQRFANTL